MESQLNVELEKNRIENIKAFHLIAGFIRSSLSEQQQYKVSFIRLRNVYHPTNGFLFPALKSATLKFHE